MVTGNDMFSRPFAVDRLAARGETAVTVRADGAEERAAIARRLRIPAVAALAVRWTLRTGAAGAIEADGVLDATVVQDCVVTLDPFEAPVVERFRVMFVPAATTDRAGPVGADDADSLDEDDLDAPDTIPFEGGTVDLGEASVEQLALALDPFPRKPGAAFDEPAVAAAQPEAASPFAVLAARRGEPPRSDET